MVFGTTTMQVIYEGDKVKILLNGRTCPEPVALEFMKFIADNTVSLCEAQIKATDRVEGFIVFDPVEEI